MVNDVDVRMTFAYVMNRMAEGASEGLRAQLLLSTFYAALAG